MGTIKNGGNGAFSGKAGSFIGSNWRDINYIKGIPRISKKPKTLKQLEQQARFALAIRMLMPIKEYLKVGFNDLKQGRSTGFNVALKNLLNKAVTGVYPALEVDYTQAEFARGPISVPATVEVTPESGKLVVTWVNTVLKTNSHTDDEFIVLVYEPGSNDYVVGPPNVPRSAGTVDVVMPSDWAGLTVHVYVYFLSKERTRVSNSKYAGTAMVF